MSYSPIEILKVTSKRIKRVFTTPKDALSTIDKLKIRFMKDKGINKYDVLGHTVIFPVHPYWFGHSYYEIFEEQVYKFTPKNNNPLIIDCGSNIGLSLLYFSRNYPGAKIIAFEPDKNLYGILNTNLDSFGLKSRIDVHNSAVWTEDTTLQFEATGGMNGAIATDTIAKAGTVAVAAERLKSYLGQKVDFLKIDIEGAEMDVLRDCIDELPNVENIFIEYHCRNNEKQELDELFRIMTNAGFRYYLRVANENMQFPYVEKIGKYMDIQLNIFGFRV